MDMASAAGKVPVTSMGRVLPLETTRGGLQYYGSDASPQLRESQDDFAGCPLCLLLQERLHGGSPRSCAGSLDRLAYDFFRFVR